MKVEDVSWWGEKRDCEVVAVWTAKGDLKSQLI